jgi:NitT/TauT family transport system permease protein
MSANLGSNRWCVNSLPVAFNSIPKVAVVPVLVLWFGIGTVPAILTAFLLSFFPIVVNVAAGIATTEPELVDVLRSFGATRTDIKVGLPRSPPLFPCLTEGGDYVGFCRGDHVGNSGEQ